MWGQSTQTRIEEGGQSLGNLFGEWREERGDQRVRQFVRESDKDKTKQMKSMQRCDAGCPLQVSPHPLYDFVLFQGVRET